MEYVSVKSIDFAVFHSLLNDYYRDGEDAQTPQEQLDDFIRFLYEQCLGGTISGCIAMGPKPVGFVLWMLDTPGGVFSQMPGYGTILEIGIVPDARHRGLGRELAEYAEKQMENAPFYVCAYGPAEIFWQKCGYMDSGELAENGLKRMTKGDRYD